MPNLVCCPVGICNCNSDDIPPVPMSNLVCSPVGPSPPAESVAVSFFLAPTEAELDELDWRRRMNSQHSSNSQDGAHISPVDNPHTFVIYHGENEDIPLQHHLGSSYCYSLLSIFNWGVVTIHVDNTTGHTNNDSAIESSHMAVSTAALNSMHVDNTAGHNKNILS